MENWMAKLSEPQREQLARTPLVGDGVVPMGHVSEEMVSRAFLALQDSIDEMPWTFRSTDVDDPSARTMMRYLIAAATAHWFCH